MSDAASALDDVGLTMAQACNLKGRDRSRLLNFLLRWERFDDLHKCLDVLIPLNPALVSLVDLRARALLAEGRAAEALAVMEERLQRRRSLTALALLARIHLAQGRLVSATGITRAMIKEREDSMLAWALLGRIELGRGDKGAARAAYLRVRDLRPHGRAYLRGMLAVHRAEGDLVTASGYAVRLLDTAREDYPLAVGDYRRLRDYFRESGETTRVAEMEAALERRHAEELAELRELLSEGGTSIPAPTPRAPEPKPSKRVEIRHVEASEPLPSFDQVPVSEQERRSITGAVQRYFGFDALLPGQLETMACVLRGEDVLTILPTGGGKSLCYQLPAMMAEGSPDGPAGRGTTLVISPLIALMKDQVDSLPRKVQARATTINSTLAGTELRHRMDSVADGAYRLVYAAPERLRQPPFLHALRRAGVERLVIDEAHCVSMWGHDFRPDYLIIGRTREALGDPPLLAMTATAPTRVRRDMLQRLQSPQESTRRPRIVAGDVTRPNLQLEVFRAAGNDEKLRYLLAFCQSDPGSGIVYADTRARCERLAALLRRHGVNAGYYHAGIGDRHRVQDDFMSGRTRVVVATIAFGLGIDKPDIRFILHFFPPASLEAYYQEAGRAGRDGLPARCVLMISPSDRALLTRRMRGNQLKVEFLRDVYAVVKKRLNGRSEGRVAMADLERNLHVEETRVRVALSLLEEAGLLHRGADLPRAANVQMSATCREEALPEEMVAFCRAARLRPQQWLTVDLAEVASKGGIALGEIEQKVLDWQDAGWLRYQPSGRDALVKLLPSPDDASDRVESLLERYEAVQAQRVDEIAAYAAATRCRHGHLNAYLGGRAIARCNACDNCVVSPPLPDPDLPDEGTQMLTVLRCISNAPWSWGRQTLVRILLGDGEARHSKRALRAEACDQGEFGALSFRSRAAVQGMVEQLEAAGLLAERRLKSGGIVLDLTKKGVVALKDPRVLRE